ncbi:NACHT domain-containing protein [Nocardia gamkensis]|uniref:NACHT domain-containing protein n=1 Tax=Nocardia gamkensis TaxID=352869 RepID=UPI0037CC75DC
MRGNLFDELPDPAKVLVIIALDHREVVRAVTTAAPRLRTFLTVDNRIAVPGTPMLALLMVAAHEYGSPPTERTLVEVHRRTRRGYLGIDSLSALFKYRSEQLRDYFNSANPLSGDLATELLIALAPSQPGAATLRRLLLEPHRRTIPDSYTPTDRIRAAVQAELDTPALTADIRTVLEAVADQLDTAPVTYPPQLKPTALARTMTVSPLADDWHLGVDHANPSLYASISRTGGEHALEALARRESPAAVLLGNPGSGKSTILAALAAYRIRTEPQHPTIHIRLPDLATVVTRTGSLPPKSVAHAASAVVAALSRWHRDSIPKPVQEMLKGAIATNSHTLLALDSWDEVSDPAHRAAVRDTLEHLSRVPGHIVITSRITGYDRPLPRQAEYLVDELTTQQADAFFDAWFTHAPGLGAQRVAEARRSSREVRDLIAIPLMAGLVAYVAEGDHVPTRKHALYQRYITRFLQRQWKPAAERRNDPVRIAQLEAVATKLAWGMATAPNSDSPLGRWCDTATVVTLLDHASGQHHDVSELIHADGLLTLHGQPDSRLTALEQEYRWLHRTIHEHLTARYLAAVVTNSPDLGRTLCRSAVLRPEWQTVLEHTIGLLNPATQEELLHILDEFAREGDPADYIHTRVQDLTTVLDFNAPRARALFATALSRHDYATAFRVDPTETIHRIRGGENNDWEAIGEILHLTPDPVDIGPDILHNIARRAKDYSARCHAVSMLAQAYPERVHHTVKSIMGGTSYPISLPVDLLPTETINWLLREIRTDWTRSLHLASATCFEPIKRQVLNALPSRILVTIFELLHKYTQNTEPFEGSIAGDPGVGELISGERGALLAFHAGQLCRVGELIGASPWARVGCWARPWRNPIPSGEWNQLRVLRALDDIAASASPADPLKIIEASQAIHLLAHRPDPVAVPKLIDVEHARHAAFDIDNLDIREVPPALLVARSALATEAMNFRDYWESAEEKLIEHGWTSSIIEIAPPPRREFRRGEDFYESIARLICRTGKPLPAHLFGHLHYPSDVGRIDLSQIMDIGATTLDSPVRESIISYASELVDESEREKNWATLVSALNGRLWKV